MSKKNEKKVVDKPKQDTTTSPTQDNGSSNPIGPGDTVKLLQAVTSNLDKEFPQGHECTVVEVDEDGSRVKLVLKRLGRCPLYDHYAFVDSGSVEVVRSLYLTRIFCRGAKVSLLQDVRAKNNDRVFRTGHVAHVYRFDLDNLEVDIDLDANNHTAIVPMSWLSIVQ